MNFQSRKLSADDVQNHGTSLCQLVVGRAVKFLEEFGDVFQDLAWADGMLAADPMTSDMISLVVLLNCHHAASYQRRVVKPLSE